MEQKEIFLLIFSASLTSLVFSISLVTLFVLYHRRKDYYRKEITKTRIEIAEQTLRNISWEIHDNVGQILSTLNLYSYKVHEESPTELKPKVGELQDLIQTAITEVRGLSKALNTDYIKNVGLIKSTELELSRFKRLKFMDTQLNVEGEPFIIPDDKEIILLRIIQEFFSNSMKYARATKMDVDFIFKGKELRIYVKDNGVGFESAEVVGTGIINMRNRAKLIGAFLNLESEINKGTRLEIIYRKKNTDNVT
ncbi:MAG TPA: ATP-binding protein [Moheibacter sp.]|nr:ATP-binding protein [Moheibacter sp.]